MNVDNETMKIVMAKAILDSMTNEARDELLSKAVTDFITKKEGGAFGTKVTPLEEAFAYATRQVAREAIKKKLDEPEFKTLITSAVNEAITKAFEEKGKRDKLIENMAHSVAAAFRVESY